MLSPFAAGLALFASAIQLPSGSLEPPPGFALQSDLPVRDTAAAAPVIGEASDPPRRLEAYFIEESDAGWGDGGQPATLSVSSVDVGLSLENEPTPIIASATMSHLHRLLDQEVSLDRVVARDRPAPGTWSRVEVWARSRIDGVPTSLVVAFFPTPDSYLALVAAVPTARLPALADRLEASLDSVQPRSRKSRFAPKRWLGQLVWGLAGLGLVGWQLVRRRSRSAS